MRTDETQSGCRKRSGTCSRGGPIPNVHRSLSDPMTVSCRTCGSCDGVRARINCVAVPGAAVERVTASVACAREPNGGQARSARAKHRGASEGGRSPGIGLASVWSSAAAGGNKANLQPSHQILKMQEQRNLQLRNTYHVAKLLSFHRKQSTARS